MISAEQKKQVLVAMNEKTGENRPKFSLTHIDEALAELVRETDKKTLAVWAIDCAGRVLPFFEENYPEDPRPRDALGALQAWIQSGVFRMADIRGASLAAHAAAREIGEDNPARSAARAAGQAVATAHVRTHSLAAAQYALQAVWRAASPPDAGAAVAKRTRMAIPPPARSKGEISSEEIISLHARSFTRHKGRNEGNGRLPRGSYGYPLLPAVDIPISV